MPGRTWLGGIYLRKGGHAIVLKALKHYQNRVQKIGNDPQLQDAAMNLRMLVAEEGKKTAQKVDVVMKIINVGRNDPKLINQVEFEIPLIEKALKCYQADIEKIADTMHERYVELFDEPKNLQEDLPLIAHALKEINKFG
jgi:dsRNA-specific ribonuclease